MYTLYSGIISFILSQQFDLGVITELIIMISEFDQPYFFRGHTNKTFNIEK